MNGENSTHADAPAAGQKDPAEAEDDSEDEQEQGEGAPEAGAAGGA